MAQQINLFNPVFLQKKKHFSAVTMLEALGLVLAGILAFYGYARYETAKLERVADDSKKQLQSQSEQIASLSREFSPQGRSKALEQEIAATAAQLKQREEVFSTLRTGALGNTDGFARYLTAFARQTRPGVWLTGINVGGDENELQLSGRVLQADLVPGYIKALNREEVMRGRRIEELRLTAREEQPPPVTAAPGANPGPGVNPPPGASPGAASPAAAPAQSQSPAASKPAALPLRFVEFGFKAIRSSTPPVATAANVKEPR